MTTSDIMNTIQYLVPGAQVSVWDRCPAIDDNQATLIYQTFGISWSDANSVPCPTAGQLDSADQTAVLAARHAVLLQTQVNAANKDINMQTGLMIYQIKNPSATMTDYITYMDSLCK